MLALARPKSLTGRILGPDASRLEGQGEHNLSEWSGFLADFLEKRRVEMRKANRSAARRTSRKQVLAHATEEPSSVEHQESGRFQPPPGPLSSPILPIDLNLPP